MNIENAKISGTFLGYDDHGIFTFTLGLTGDGWGVGFGNRALDDYDGRKRERVPQPAALNIIPEILKVVGVDRWEELKGKHVRVETNGLGRSVTRIGNLIDNNWLALVEFFS